MEIEIPKCIFREISRLHYIVNKVWEPEVLSFTHMDYGEITIKAGDEEKWLEEIPIKTTKKVWRQKND